MSIAAIPSDPFTRRLQKIGQMIANGDLPNAASEMNAALKEQPNDPRIYLLGMRLSEAKGEPERALEDVRKAVSLNPVWVVSVTELAMLLSRLGRHDEAIQQAKKAAALEPNSIDMLTRAVDIAHSALKFDVALGWLARLADLRPANAHYKALMAHDHRFLGDNAKALAIYQDLLAVNPLDTVALLGRAQTSWDNGDTVTAQQDCATLVSVQPDHPVFQFWHAFTHGQTPSTMPLDMVRSVHDGSAATYDEFKVKLAQYHVPKVMGEMIKARYPSLEINVLDLGCGTGLVGVCLGRLNGALVGVDISMGMVAQIAKHQGLYDKVHTVNVLDALQATPDALYHVITASDVFSYVGDLSQAIPNALRIVRPDGHFVFSCELALEFEADLVLRPSMRFAHKRSAIEAQCKAAGFDEVEVFELPLYNDKNGPVQGYIVIAHKPA